MIALHNVHFSYDGTPVLRGVDWQLPPSGIVCLRGASGCGKTTLLRLLAGLEQPSSGRVIGLDDKRVAVCFQEDRLLPWCTALENVTLACGESDRARQLLCRFGLEDCLHSRPTQMSGGQQRRVALARALSVDADILLLDEPFTGMDTATWGMVVPTIAAFAATHPVVLVTHVIEEAQMLSARVLELGDAPLSGSLSVSADE